MWEREVTSVFMMILSDCIWKTHTKIMMQMLQQESDPEIVVDVVQPDNSRKV